MMQGVLERRHHTKIATASPERPEEIGMFRIAGSDAAAVVENDLSGKQVIDGVAAPTHEPPESTTKRQARDARG